MTIILPSDNSIAPHKFTDLSSEQNSIAFRLDYDLDNAIDPSNTGLLLSGLKAINKAKKVDSRIVKYSEIPDADDKVIIENQKHWILLGLANSDRSIGHFDDVLSVTTEAVNFF